MKFQVQEARGQHDDEAVKWAINEYEDALARYIPVLMAQAKIYWELDMYQQVMDHVSNLMGAFSTKKSAKTSKNLI